MASKPVRALHLLVVAAMLLTVFAAGVPVAKAAPTKVDPVKGIQFGLAKTDLTQTLPTWPTANPASMTDPVWVASTGAYGGFTSFKVQYQLCGTPAANGTITVKFFVGNVTSSPALTINLPEYVLVNPAPMGSCGNKTTNVQTTVVPVPAGMAEGLYDLSIQAYDGENVPQNIATVTEQKAVRVDNPPPVVPADTIQAPPEGPQQWQIGSHHTIMWYGIFDPGFGPNNVRIFLQVSADNGANWRPINGGNGADNFPADSEGNVHYNWKVNSYVSDQSRLRLVARDLAGNSRTSNPSPVFTIWGADQTPPEVKVLDPKAIDEDHPEWIAGDAYDVEAWADDYESGVATVDFYYSLDNKATWIKIGTALGEGEDGTSFHYPWDTTVIPDGSLVQVKAIATNGVGNTRESAINDWIYIDNAPINLDLVQPTDNSAVGFEYKLQATASTDFGSIDEVVFQYSRADTTGWTTIGVAHKDWYSADLYSLMWNTGALPEGAGYQVRVVANKDVNYQDEGDDVTAIAGPVDVTIDHSRPVLPKDFIEAPVGHDLVFKVGTVVEIRWLLGINDADNNLLAKPIALNLCEEEYRSPEPEQFKKPEHFVKVCWPIAQVANAPLAPPLGNGYDGGYSWTVMGVPTAVDDPGWFDMLGKHHGGAWIQFVVSDQAGNTAVENSERFSIWGVNPAKPTVSITEPTSGQYFYGWPPVKVTEVATDQSTLIWKVETWICPETKSNNVWGCASGDWELFDTQYQPVDGAAVPTNPSFTFEQKLWHLEDGLYSIKARAFNGVGVFNDSAVVTDVAVDKHGPHVSWLEPDDWHNVANGVVRVQAKAFSFSGVQSVGLAFVASGPEDPEYADAAPDVALRMQRWECPDDPLPWENVAPKPQQWTALTLGSTIPAQPAYDVPFWADWDTTGLPDGKYCLIGWATNRLDNLHATEGWVKRVLVRNTTRVRTELGTYGWSLISLPRIPFSTKTADVLSDVQPSDLKIKQVYTYVYDNNGNAGWKMYIAGNPGNTLTNMYDGQGYFVLADQDGKLVNHGYWMAPGPVGPRSYPVNIGWNLIGYHPTSVWEYFSPKTVAQYLGQWSAAHIQSMYRMEGEGKFIPVMPDDLMRPGAGYWLYSDAKATIAP